MISWPAAARKSAACFAACVASGEIIEPIGEAVHRAILAVVFGVFAILPRALGRGATVATT